MIFVKQQHFLSIFSLNSNGLKPKYVNAIAWPSEPRQGTRNFALNSTGDWTQDKPHEHSRNFALNLKEDWSQNESDGKHNVVASTNIDFIHFLPEWGKSKLNFRAILVFPGRLPVWKVNLVAERSEVGALAFLPSSRHRVEDGAKIDRVAERRNLFYIFL